jgi:syntaxin 6
MLTILDDNNSLLDDLGDHVDRSQSKLKRAMSRVTDILRKEEGNKSNNSSSKDIHYDYNIESKSGYCICCLIIILIILLVLVIMM